ncbi:ferredoxin reductase family protein [Actinokineospora auranticolor]|uniref:Putative ferric reductase n=1 Tax=Actinokineospora auranticolor TaxID=155976 RepID=A0A2S6H0Z3_9PSEU|nr:ferredoxin reductase family protein [Actinokineospora auranticolor]PPK71086.1 putative ferric reductase [Actinokineospora auranticolor]
MTALTEPPTLPATVPTTSPAGVDRGVRIAAGSALWAALLLVTYWWTTGGGLGALAEWESGLTSLGRLTGLVASVLLLAQVLMMARVPVLERAFGQDRLVRHHRVVGFTSVNLMLAHVVLITWGYAAGDLVETPATSWQLVTEYPGMLLALAGTVCLVLTAVTSVKAARRKIRYESWHLLHLYAYLGVGLALPHQLWTGQDFLSSTATTVFWWSLWGASVGAVLVWRLGVPITRNLRHRLRVSAVVPEGDGVYSVHLTGRDLRLFPAQAGQFLGWRFLDRKGWTRGNPYSLSAAPDGRGLRITVQALGDNSIRVAQLRPGTRVLFEGPFGRLTERARASRKVALIGAGVGIAPLRALAGGMAYAPGEAVVLHRFTDRPLFETEFQDLARQRGLRVVPLPGHRRGHDSWLGDGVARLDDLAVLRALVPDIADHDVYVCGPAPWAALVCRTVQAAGLPAARLHVEHFEW